MTPSYLVHYTSQLPAVKSGWDDPAWAKAEPLNIDQFHPKSSDHHPPEHAGCQLYVGFEDRFPWGERWCRLFEQIFRVDKWSLLPG